MTTAEDYPVVQGFADRFGYLCVWCDWCCDWHYHGMSAQLRYGTTTTKGAHCYAVNGPYGSGYRVRFNKAPAEQVRAAMRRATSLQYPAMQEGRTTPALERLRAQKIPAAFLDEESE